MFTLCVRLLRNFIWSMTSWRRGHTCQQHSTTTQPSRPSKARPVWRPQLFLHTTVLSRRGAVVHTAWFLFLEGFGYLTAGVVATIKTALPFQNYMLPKKKNTNTCSVFILYVSPVFFFFCLVLSRVCVMFTSLNLKPVLLQKRRTDLVAQDSDRTRGDALFSQVLRAGKKSRGKQSEHPQTQVKGWKKCNVYCCTIFSNKRTQNLFVIFFFYVNTPW